MYNIMKRNNQGLIAVGSLLFLLCNIGIAHAQQPSKQTLSDFGSYQQKALACSVDSLADTTALYKIRFNYRTWFTEQQGRKWLVSHGGEVLPSTMAGPAQAHRLLWHGYALDCKNDTTTLPVLFSRLHWHPYESYHRIFSYGKRYVIITGDAIYTLVGDETQEGYFNTYYLEKLAP